MNMKASGLAPKNQADIVAGVTPSTNTVVEERLESLPGLSNVFQLSSEERKAMFVTALRSRKSITKFAFRLGDYEASKLKRELVNLPGLKDLHLRSYEDIASTLVAATQLKDDFVGLEYCLDEDRNGTVVNKLSVEFGVKINPANCQPDEEGKVKDKHFGPHFQVEYTT